MNRKQKKTARQVLGYEDKTHGHKQNNTCALADRLSWQRQDNIAEQNTC